MASSVLLPQLGALHGFIAVQGVLFILHLDLYAHTRYRSSVSRLPRALATRPSWVNVMAAHIIHSVFVSSTYEDLREERAEVQKSLWKLHCMPIGMEIFGSADEETWEFIKRQIADCDYYIVIIADRYGSVAADGISYTEKEYDYAREIGKPVLAFVHGDRGALPRDRTEPDAAKRQKLEEFIAKVRRSPVSDFRTPHELATNVTVSFINLRERRPATGFIRADQAADLAKYAAVLEENARLRDEKFAPLRQKIRDRIKSGVPPGSITPNVMQEILLEILDAATR